MKAIIPVTVDDSVLTSTDVPENDNPVWNIATAYSIGDKVMITTGVHKNYECLISNTGQDPSTSPVDGGGLPYWLDLGATNAWAMFDEVVNSQTEQATSIQVVLTPGVRVNSMAFLNLLADSVTISVSSATGGGIVFNETFDLNDNTSVTSWYTWLFSPIKKKLNLTVFGIPNYVDNVITVTIVGSTAKIGGLIIGDELSIGDTIEGMSPGIIDYSRKSTDSFGNVTVVKRNTARRLNANIIVDSINLDYIFDRLDEYASVPLVWVASDVYTSGIIYGFYKNFDPAFTTNTKSYISLEIEGLT